MSGNDDKFQVESPQIEAVSAAPEMKVHIRWMIRRDMPEVLEIERASSPEPMDEETMTDRLRERNVIGMVAERGDAVLGFMIYQLQKGRLVVLKLAVGPNIRRLGVGRQMVRKLKGKLSATGRTKILLHARETNLAGQLFLRSEGFEAVRVDRGHYDDTGEDGYLMRLTLRTKLLMDGLDRSYREA